MGFRAVRKVGGLRGQAGYITVLTMVLGAICSVLLMQTISYSVASRKQIIISRDIARYSSILDSILDYTSYGIKNRWCFTGDTWLQDTSAGCNLSNPLSTEAMLLSLQSLKSLRDRTRLSGDPMPAIGNATKMNVTVPVSQIGASHPLFKAINGLATSTRNSIDSINIQVIRMDSSDYPTRGSEAAVKIIATINAADQMRVFGNFSSVSATSMVLIAPRELNYFSVILPRDLRLDNGIAGQGDLSIPINTGGAGVTFASPIFVNRDIHLPIPGQKTSATFAGKVVLGDGALFLQGTPYAPQTAGGEGNRFYSDFSTFGGFIRGIDIDGAQDKGLNFLANLVSGGGTSTNLAAMNKCKEFSLADMDLKKTQKTDLLVRPIGPLTLDSSTFLFGLNGYNHFMPQGFDATKVGGFGAVTSLPPDEVVAKISVRVVYQPPRVRVDGVWTTPAPVPRSMTIQAGRGTTAAMQVNQNVQAIVTTSDGSVPRQDNLLQVQVRLTASVLGALNRITEFHVTMHAYDVGFFGGQNRRIARWIAPVPPGTDPTAEYSGTTYSEDYPRTTEINCTVVPGTTTLNCPAVAGVGPHFNGYFKTSGGANPIAPGPEATFPEDGGPSSFNAFKNTCTLPRGPGIPVTSGSFQVARWDDEGFLDADTRNAWTFGGNTSNTSSAPPILLPLVDPNFFYVGSIVGTCTIPASTNFVAGFLNCDNFNILTRTTPLTIVGTVIASKMTIAPEAVRSGVTFMSIYHPTAVFLLRDHNILTGFKSSCGTKPTPVWHPEPSPEDFFDLFNCSTTSLRTKADPFTWTTVSPDCGTKPGESIPTCLHRPRHFLLREISRQSDLQ